jgi:hypothetical protein
MSTKPVSTLEVKGFQEYTRATYFAKFGKPAPPADSTKRAKSWVGSGRFFFLTGMALVPGTVPESENDVNLDGVGPFPAYVIAPTKASSDGPGGQPYNALYLSLESDARALMAEVGGSNLVDEGANVFLPLSYPADEPRREWEFTDKNGIKVNVGAMLFIKNMNGIGSPGAWDTSTPVPTWVPAIHPVTAGDPWGLPCRALAPNESIGPSGIFGMATLIISDGADPNSTPAPAAGGYTQADRDRDNTILGIVEQLAQK